MKLRNFGKKSLTEIVYLVENKLKLNFGMDISKYNIDKKE